MKAFPLVRRARLTRAQNQAAGLEHSLTHNADEAKRREQIARQQVADEKSALIASVVADYYRAWAACDDRPERRGTDDPFISRQHGIMDHAVTMLARLTGKDSLTIGFALDQGTPVADEPRMPGDQIERQAALLAPFRAENAGTYAHLAPERGGPTSDCRDILASR